jgi:hypothetical protein
MVTISTYAKENVNAALPALANLWLLASRTSQKLLCRCLLHAAKAEAFSLAIVKDEKESVDRIQNSGEKQTGTLFLGLPRTGS